MADLEGNWLSPEEITSEDGKKIYKENDNSKPVIVGPSESMSKSKKNTINPEDIINNYGADAVRLFILSDSPPEKDIQWSDQGMLASFKFLQKMWTLHQKIMVQLSSSEVKFEKKDDPSTKNLSEFTNILINKITNNLEKFHYNVIIANFYETYNFLNKLVDEKIDTKILKKNYIDIVKLLFPIIPHFASEALEQLNQNNSNFWPQIDKKFLIKKNVNIIVQINGKKRSIINTKLDIKEETLINLIRNNQNLSKFLEGNIIKCIFIKNKLINLIIK